MGEHVMAAMLPCGQSPPSPAEGSDGGNGPKDKGERGEGHRKEFNFWTDQEVWLLLDAYEEKWNQLDRGNVKSKHWEEIASRLASQNSGMWAAKTPTQCKNKIEDMKKKYRAEKAMKHGPGSVSKWVFFQRMESLLRNGFKGAGTETGEPSQQQQQQQGGMELEAYANCGQLESLQQFRQCGPGRVAERDLNDEEDHGFSTSHHVRKDNGGGLVSLLDRGRDDGGAPKRRRQSESCCSSSMAEVVQVIKSFGESLLRIEEAQLQMQREVARMNAEAELRRIDMEVKRAEMMRNTQLQIAKILGAAAAAKPRKKKPARRAGGNEDEQQQQQQEANGSRSMV